MTTHTPFMLALAGSGFFNELTGEGDLKARCDDARKLEELLSETAIPIIPDNPIPKWAQFKGKFAEHDKAVYFNETHYQYADGDCIYTWGTTGYTRQNIVVAERVNSFCKY